MIPCFMKTDIIKVIMYDSTWTSKLRVLPRVKPQINGDQDFESGPSAFSIPPLIPPFM
jgi:hypothetical protein